MDTVHALLSYICMYVHGDQVIDSTCVHFYFIV